MSRVEAGLLLLLAVPVLWGLMLLGWRRRAARQRDGLPPLPEPPDDPGRTLLPGSVEGIYVSTTGAGDWLDRVAAHGLGNRAVALVDVTSRGVTIRRQGERVLFIPAASVLGVRTQRGIAGKFAGREDIVVVSWQLGPHRLDTGLRTRFTSDREPLIDAVRRLAAADVDHGSGGAA